MKRPAVVNRDTREGSFGQSQELTVVDKFGVWLSKRQIQHTVGDSQGEVRLPDRLHVAVHDGSDRLPHTPCASPS